MTTMFFTDYKKSIVHFCHRVITLANNLGDTPGYPQTPLYEPKTILTHLITMFLLLGTLFLDSYPITMDLGIYCDLFSLFLTFFACAYYFMYQQG